VFADSELLFNGCARRSTNRTNKGANYEPAHSLAIEGSAQCHFPLRTGPGHGHCATRSASLCPPLRPATSPLPPRCLLIATAQTFIALFDLYALYMYLSAHVIDNKLVLKNPHILALFPDVF
jgi:hypothetical protein